MFYTIWNIIKVNRDPVIVMCCFFMLHSLIKSSWERLGWPRGDSRLTLTWIFDYPSKTCEQAEMQKRLLIIIRNASWPPHFTGFLWTFKGTFALSPCKLLTVEGMCVCVYVNVFSPLFTYHAISLSDNCLKVAQCLWQTTVRVGWATFCWHVQHSSQVCTLICLGTATTM